MKKINGRTNMNIKEISINNLNALKKDATTVLENYKKYISENNIPEQAEKMATEIVECAKDKNHKFKNNELYIINDVLRVVLKNTIPDFYKEISINEFRSYILIKSFYENLKESLEDIDTEDDFYILNLKEDYGTSEDKIFYIIQNNEVTKFTENSYETCDRIDYLYKLTDKEKQQLKEKYSPMKY